MAEARKTEECAPIAASLYADVGDNHCYAGDTLCGFDCQAAKFGWDHS